MPYDFNTVSELAVALTNAHRDARALRREVLIRSNDAAEMVSHLWNFAGVTDAESNTHGAEVIRDMTAVAELIEAILPRINRVADALKKGLNAVDEAEAKRKAARGRLTI